MMMTKISGSGECVVLNLCMCVMCAHAVNVCLRVLKRRIVSGCLTFARKQGDRQRCIDSSLSLSSLLSLPSSLSPSPSFTFCCFCFIGVLVVVW